MATVARGVDGGTDINVLVDGGATGDMQIVKLAVSSAGAETLLPGDAGNGLDVDVTRLVPGTTASSLGKAEDAIAASGDTGVFALVIRRDTPAADAADGDYVGLHVDSLGRLQIAGNQAEDAVAGSGDTGQFVLAIRRDTPVADAADGDYQGLHVDALGKLQVAATYPEDQASVSGDMGNFVLAIRRDTATADGANGDYVGLHVDALGKLRIVGSYLEDAASANGDAGLFMLAIRRDAPTSGAAAGDYHEIEVDALGRLWVSGTFAEDAAHASGDYGHFVMGVQSLARTARSADNDYTPFAVGAAGEQFVANVPEANSAWAATNYAALAAASGVIKASAGKLLKVTLTNDNAAARYIQFFNLTAAPVDGTAPLFAIKLGIGETRELHWEPFGKYFSTGISWCNSTTGATKTIGAADTYVEATYL